MRISDWSSTCALPILSYGLQQTFPHLSIDRIETDCTKEKIQEAGNGYMRDNRHSAARTVFNVGDRTPAMEDNVYVADHAERCGIDLPGLAAAVAEIDLDQLDQAAANLRVVGQRAGNRNLGRRRQPQASGGQATERKSTRLNSSHQ